LRHALVPPYGSALTLATAGCGPVTDSEQIRVCRLVPQALHPDGTQIREIRVAPVPGCKIVGPHRLCGA